MTTLRWQGRFIEVHVDGTWEYVKRTREIGAAVILAVTDAGEVVLVEQPRAALKARTIELPAGLVGDDTPGEDAAVTAARELEEETGFTAGTIEQVGEFASSPGMVGETFRLFRARDLRRTGAGGGVAGEHIAVHLVPLADVPAFLDRARAEGKMIDVKLLSVLQLV